MLQIEDEKVKRVALSHVVEYDRVVDSLNNDDPDVPQIKIKRPRCDNKNDSYNDDLQRQRRQEHQEQLLQ